MNDYLEYRELYHHGILGQKWGRRRFQNPDGSLTEAGRLRYGKKADKKERKFMKKAAKRAAKNVEKIATYKTTDDSVHKLTDEELVKKVGRLRLEEEAVRLQAKLKEYDAKGKVKVKSPKESQGFVKEFVNSAMTKAIIPAATETGKKYVTSYLEDKLGLKTKSPLAALEEQSKMLSFKTDIARKTKELSDITKAKQKEQNRELWEEWFASYDFSRAANGTDDGAGDLYEWLKR